LKPGNRTAQLPVAGVGTGQGRQAEAKLAAKQLAEFWPHTFELVFGFEMNLEDKKRKKQRHKRVPGVKHMFSRDPYP
jgi:hypothetical protein